MSSHLFQTKLNSPRSNAFPRSCRDASRGCWLLDAPPSAAGAIPGCIGMRSIASSTFVSPVESGGGRLWMLDRGVIARAPPTWLLRALLRPIW